MSEQCIDQSSGTVADRRMHDHAGGFIDDDDVVIFIHDVERDLFGLGRHIVGIGSHQRDGNAVPVMQATVGFHRDSVDQERTGEGRALNLRARAICQSPGQKLIDPLAFVCRVGVECK
jgi:hypothetical protein